ncbi:4Fe-4S binding protein [Methanobrevibacter sp. OttesenSCG-928-K11]|nr:4Fe-4S binding protein [Methanobrevibacter sp. OttesenSCG-928-K11]MDL2270539.1 4Fe-4S binding protein [Methanobrevibacter sp. OttesenSCG-928-I08]
MIVKDWCSFCGECAGVCPRNLIEVKEYSLIFSDTDCKECDFCINACPLNALERD